MKRIRIVALVAGVAVDLFGTILVSVSLITLILFQINRGEPAAVAMQKLAADPFLLGICYFGGIVCTLAGAYVTARMSRPYSLLNALVFGVFSTLLGVCFASIYPLWYNVLCVLTIIPVALVPGYLLAKNSLIA